MYFHRVFTSTNDSGLGEVFEDAQRQPIIVPAFHIVVLRLFILSFNQFGKAIMQSEVFDPKKCEQWLKDHAALQELIRNEEYVVVTQLLGGEVIERKMKAFKAWRVSVKHLLNQSCTMDEAKAALEKGKAMLGEESEEYRALEAKVEETNAWVEKMKEMSEDGARREME